MFFFAAHTGARRSEMLRSEIDDIDFYTKSVTIREKKRVRGTVTTRTVPLSPELERVLTDWFDEHPGGSSTFCHQLDVRGSKKQRTAYGSLTKDEAVTHFRCTLDGGKWQKIRGWHTFRHSFCSNCAAAGIDQRFINAWVGHQTDEMVRRYRHLIPNQQLQEIQRVFVPLQPQIHIDETLNVTDMPEMTAG